MKKGRRKGKKLKADKANEEGQWQQKRGRNEGV
jgi:hypothetical protein